MKTLTITINDATFARLELVADLKGLSVEDEVLRHIAIPEGESLINDRDELLRQVGAHHAGMRVRGAAPLTDEQIREYKNEGRE